MIVRTAAARAGLAPFAPMIARAGLAPFAPTIALAALMLVALTMPAEARKRHASFFGVSTVLHPDCNVTMPCDLRSSAQPSKREQARRARGKRIERAMPFGKATRARAAARSAALANGAEGKKAVKLAARAPAPVRAAAPPPTPLEFFVATVRLLTPPDGIAAALELATRDIPRTAPTIAGYIARALRGSVSLAGVVPPLAAKAAEIRDACGSRVVSAVRRTYVAGTRRISLHAHGQAVDMAGNPSCIYARLKGWRGGYSTDYARVAHVHISWSGGGREWGARFVHRGHRSARRVRLASAQ